MTERDVIIKAMQRLYGEDVKLYKDIDGKIYMMEIERGYDLVTFFFNNDSGVVEHFNIDNRLYWEGENLLSFLLIMSTAEILSVLLYR